METSAERDPKTYHLTFAAANRDIFEMIVRGEKIVETRAATIKYRNIQAGDMLVLSCGKDRLSKRVSRATHFKTVSAMLKSYQVEHIHPKIHTQHELEETYRSFPGYEAKIKEHGIIAFEIE